MATGNYTLPPLAALEIFSEHPGERWRRFKWAWDSYTRLNEKAKAVHVATLLTIIGKEACEVYSTFTGWAHEDDRTKIVLVLKKFRQYCPAKTSRSNATSSTVNPKRPMRAMLNTAWH